MSDFSFVVHAENGAIRRYGYLPSFCGLADVPLEAGETALAVASLEGIDDTTHYVAGGSVAPRPAQETTADRLQVSLAAAELVTLSGIPEGAVVRIEADEYPVAGGAAEIALPFEGVFKVTVIAWPYRDCEIEVEVLP